MAVIAIAEMFGISGRRDELAMLLERSSQEFADFQLGLDGLLARPSESTVYSIEGAVRPVNTRPMDPRDAD